MPALNWDPGAETIMLNMMMINMNMMMMPLIVYSSSPGLSESLLDTEWISLSPVLFTKYYLPRFEQKWVKYIF